MGMFEQVLADMRERAAVARDAAKHNPDGTVHHEAVPHGMVIHHKDFDRMNNSFDNLVCITKEEHDRLHSAMRERDEKGRFK